jgi:hypothetical protein
VHQQARIQGDGYSLQKTQRLAPVRPLVQNAAAAPDHNDAVVVADATGGCSCREMGDY